MALSVTILQNKCTSKTETNRFQVVLICCLLTERLALCGGCSHLITLPRHLSALSQATPRQTENDALACMDQEHGLFLTGVSHLSYSSRTQASQKASTVPLPCAAALHASATSRPIHRGSSRPAPAPSHTISVSLAHTYTHTTKLN